VKRRRNKAKGTKTRRGAKRIKDVKGDDRSARLFVMSGERDRIRYYVE